MEKRPATLFITGTNTGVGKTFVAALLSAAISARGYKLKVFKPVETGCLLGQDNELIPSDGELLRQCAASDQSIEEIVPWRFKPAVAPIVAAASVGVEINTEQIETKISEATSGCDLVIVEGAGGLLVPISERHNFADLATRCQMSVLVVVGSRLGALNEALLTFEVLRERKADVVGYVFNNLFSQGEPGEGMEQEALSTNREVLSKLSNHYDIAELTALPRYERVLTAEKIKLLAETVEVSEFSDKIINYFGL